jgi:hypothetical protein
MAGFELGVGVGSDRNEDKVSGVEEDAGRRFWRSHR